MYENRHAGRTSFGKVSFISLTGTGVGMGITQGVGRMEEDKLLEKTNFLHVPEESKGKKTINTYGRTYIRT